MNSLTLDSQFGFRIIARQGKRRAYFCELPELALVIVLVLSSMSLPTLATADQAVSHGAVIARACATCHGPGGRSQGAIPSINSLPKENFMTAMRAFQTGERQGTVMNRIAKGLDNLEVEAVAAYFANLEKH